MDNRKLHCALVPLMGLGGHIIPMVDMGFLLAEQGIAVTIYTTQATADRIQPVISRARSSGLTFDVEVLPFETGHPESAEDTKSFADAGAMLASLHNLAQPLYDRLAHQRSAGNETTFLLVDYCHHWSISVAADLGVPLYVFYNIPCFVVLCYRLLLEYYLDPEGAPVGDVSKPVLVPEFPHRVAISYEQAIGSIPGFDMIIRGNEEIDTVADGILLNTVSALEREYVELHARRLGKKVWPVGPVSLCNEGDPDRAAARGGKSSPEVAGMLEWLDSKERNSVVYFALGSMARLSPAQVEEIGAGLESAGHPFILVVHISQEDLQEVQSWLQTSGFVERNKGHGVVITGWAPQQLILSHASVGGFVTHCGWNSVLEAITSGKPVATWPRFADQFINERMMVDVFGIGVPVGVQKQQLWWSTDDEEVVKRELVAGAVAELMGEGEEAKNRRKNVEALMVKARAAMVEEVAESRMAVAAFIEDASCRAKQLQLGPTLTQQKLIGRKIGPIL